LITDARAAPVYPAQEEKVMELLKLRIHQRLEQDYNGSHLKGFAGMKILADQARQEEKSDTVHQTGTKGSFTPITKHYQELIDKIAVECPPLATYVTSTWSARIFCVYMGTYRHTEVKCVWIYYIYSH